MPRAKKEKPNLDQPATQRQLMEITEMIKEFGTILLEKIEKVSQRVQEISQKVQEVSQKVDVNTSAIQSLDKRVRYQDDMPERLEHVLNQQYDLSRRVTALENPTQK